ncbi:hypothetical protein ARMGADRAFT_1084956 [Armillaria gallica]|uniref:F-box domain-containing protein n=1 Tax=Armillaria gallica TaxID=47427 RepID=A0A2H3CY55_ARMGA|nr:hypothetical protein ARMGADRAFT_1084956 [Armillaria gallica]
MLDKLPSELLQEIFSLVHLKEHRALRLACKSLNDSITPILLQTVSINLNYEKTFHASILLLRALGSSQNNPGKFVKCLRIHSSFDPPCENYRHLWHRVVRKRRRVVCRIEKLILDALPSLISLRSIEFCFYHTSELSVSALDSIMCRISALPRLDTLTLHAYSHDYPMKHQQQFFSYFHHLRDITITGQMIDAIPHIIAKSPGLFRLRLVSTEPVTNLHSVLDLFPLLPPAFRCSVEQLTLEGNFTLPQPDIVPVIPHLRHLTSLRLLIHDISDAFWTALSVESIHVKEISVDIGSDALLDYLCSYSGITMMMLIVDRGVIEAGALKFWNQVLPRHANTMKRLYVHSQSAGMWCIDSGPLRCLMQCTNLEILSVVVDRQRADIDGPGNIVTRVLGTLGIWKHMDLICFLSTCQLNEDMGNPITTRHTDPERIHDLISAFQCRQPTDNMHHIMVESDLARYMLGSVPTEPDIFSFLVTRSHALKIRRP